MIVANEGTKGHVTADAVAFIPLDKEPPDGEAKPDGEGRRAGRRCKALEARAEEAPGERPEAADGDVGGRGDEDRGRRRSTSAAASTTSATSAPRGFLQVATDGTAAGDARRTRAAGVQLADWIASTDNPLTARVFANRAWHWLFGAGHRPHRGQLRHHRRAAVAPGAARPPRGAVRRRRLVGEEAGPRDRAEPHLPAGAPTADAEGRRRRPGEPPVRPGEPPAARGRVHPRHDAGRQRQARRRRAAGRRSRRASRPTTATSTPTRAAASTCRCSATRCRSCSRCSTSPTRAW